MPLQVEPVRAQDFDTMASHAFHDGGDLSAPIVPAVWPTTPDAASMARRTRWSMKQQREMFDDDPSARFLKVVDTDRGDDIIALARWHYYPDGYKYPEWLPWEFNGAAPDAEQTWPAEVNVAMHKDFVRLILEQRPQWQGQRPMWVLTTIVTKEAARKRGAGSMLVRWGMERARADGVPAFLEAGPLGRPVYEKCGFKEVGKMHVDMSKHGEKEPVVNVQMAYNLPPESG